MAISLNKGGNLSLSKTDPNLVRILIGLGWDERATDGAAFDLDASAFLLTATGKVRGDHDFIFYNQLKSQDGSVEHTGDNRSGQGDGDDETLLVDLSKVSPEIEKIAITVTIHDAQARGQNFGQIANAFIRVVNQDTNVEVVRFDLAEDYSTETAMVFGEVYRHNGEWKFKAVGQGYAGGLAAMCQQYGIQVG
ncbi:TerD family protein [Acinetobacter higginsii]|uniref:TerD family protein n=1 Tax=Acinetobacter higginsii TaxID=70347 RepID=UPI001F4A31F0|nr:TerD family protein [Acinetobacter higginsii]MCH7340053.1 TerD family protein [Acinetobacter higginsii]MCI3878014.1 TerD family protein [Acinetobacter higginsii]